MPAAGKSAGWSRARIRKSSSARWPSQPRLHRSTTATPRSSIASSCGASGRRRLTVCSARRSASRSSGARASIPSTRARGPGSTESQRVLARHRRAEARRLRATAALAASREPPLDPAQRAAAALDARELWPRVADAIAGLPAGERDALLLHVWEDLPYEEIAAALGIPIGTVRSRLNRARRRLRELTARCGEQTLAPSAARDGKIES